MIVVVDVKCTHCSEISEAWLDNKETTAPCPRCNHLANRIISPVATQLNSTFPGWRQKFDKQKRKDAAVTETH